MILFMSEHLRSYAIREINGIRIKISDTPELDR